MAFGSRDLCSLNKNCPLIVYMYTIYTAHWPIMNNYYKLSQSKVHQNFYTNKQKQVTEHEVRLTLLKPTVKVSI